MMKSPARSADSPAFLVFGLVLGTGGALALLLATARLGPINIPPLLLLAAIALTMRLNTFTIPPRILVSLVSTVQMAAVILLGGTEAAWISVATFLLATLIRHPAGVGSRIVVAVVSFNIGMEAFMTLAAGAVYRRMAEASWPGAASPVFLLTPFGILSIVAMAVTIKAVNETLMTAGFYLRGSSVPDYLAGARRVWPVEAGMLPLGLLLALVGQTAGAPGLGVAALVLVLASVLVKRLSDAGNELHRINLDLERRVGELDVLGRVGREISSAIEIDQVLDVIRRHCSELVNTGNFFIALLDREAGLLELALNFEGGRRMEKQQIRLGEGLTSLVIQRREPLLIGDLDREAGSLPIQPVQFPGMRARSWLGVPLIAGDEVLGVMTVQDERAEAYDEETVRVLTTIAAQAAISIRNAQLVRRIIDQARLEQENRDLRLLNQRKNEFVSMVAHQLQSPLTSIIGFSDLARRQIGSGAPASHIETIHRESRRLSELVEQLLSLSRIRSGRIIPARRRVDLNAIAREVVDSQVLLIREREITIEVDLDPAGLPVEVDPVLVHQAVANLVNNALKYSPAGSTVWIRTERGSDGGVAADEGMVRLQVRDRGRGVAPEDRDRIFDEFYRAQSTEKRQVKGSGLGLTISKEIVEIHGGKIGYEAGDGGGSIFSFTLPAAS